MAAVLVDIGNRDGRASADGWTLVASPLAELSERSGRGRNCGTIYAHVRALRDADAVRRPIAQTGLLLDLRALSDIGDHATQRPSPAPHNGRGPQRSAAQRSGVPESDPASPPGQEPSEISEVLAVLRQVLKLLERILDRAPKPGPGHELDDMAHQVDRLADLADGPRDEPRKPRTVRDTADGPRYTDRREGGRILTKDADQPLPPSLRRPTIRDVRDQTASRTSRNLADGAEATDTGPIGERGIENRLTDHDLDDLVLPLAQLAQRSGLVGMTNIADTRDAIRPYSGPEIRHAVAMIAAMTRAGSVKSPIGWLVTKARQGDTNYFTEQVQPAPNPTPVVPPAPDTPEVDIEADLAVTALEADPKTHRDALAQLDKHIISTLGPATARRVTASPTSLHATRVSFWRWSRPSPPAKEE